MSTLQSVVEWAENDLVDWQSDAVRRLLTQDELSEDDRNQLLAMIKERHDLADPQNPAPKPQPIKKGQVSGVPQVPSKVTLKLMRIDCNVNAIPDGSELSFGHEGITVIYGENASGKSGYARVLKKACSARDTKENILPNAFLQSISSPAKACLKVSINNGPDQDINWEDGQEPNTILSSICVFDSKCARVIVNENNEITYLPYGAHVFEALVLLLQDLRRGLEIAKPDLKKLDYPDIPASTRAGKLIASLFHSTPDDEIEKAAKWADADEKNLKILDKRIACAEAHDPQQQAQRIRNLKIRLEKLKEKVIAVDAGLAKTKAQELRQSIENLAASEKALAIVSQTSLSKEPLAGVGEDAWQKLYYAAKAYSIEKAYPGQDFPVLETDSRCVLCMQPLLEDAMKRMLRFKEFMENTTKKEVEVSLSKLESIKETLEAIEIPAPEAYQDVKDEIRNRNPQFANQLDEYIKLASNRATAMVKAAKDNRFQTLPDLGTIKFEFFTRIKCDLESEALEIENAADPETLEKLYSQRAELKGRKLLKERKKEILEYVEQLKTAQKYDECIAETDSRSITLKGKEVITKSLTPQLQTALGIELKALNVDHLQLNMKPTGSKGETLHRMELVGCRYPKEANLTDILSEGEQHVIAIAGFLAELQVANTQSPIVFDDPVCSLDHLYREKIAQRLAEEAHDRQIIVFTHDISFLLELKSKAGELQGTYFLPQTVLKVANAPGQCIEGLTWHAMSVKDRTAFLNKQLNNFRSYYNNNLQEYNREAGQLYGMLRETWEAVIEEVLFQGAIIRHSGEVQTLKLSYVTVTDEDYRTIHLGMAKSSKWMFGHDKSHAIDANRPSPDEIQQDIASLRDFAKSINSRRDNIRKQRLASLEPKIPAAG